LSSDSIASSPTVACAAACGGELPSVRRPSRPRPESETQLGDPGELAGEFAAELAADDARRVARNSLSALRALRRRGSRRLPDAEVALIHRRSAVAVGAGLATCVALLLYAADHTQQMAGWRLALQAGLAAAAGLALIVVAVQARSSRQTRGAVPGPSGGIVADVPPLALVAAHPRTACVATAVTAGIADTVLGGFAERSSIEGLERGTFEAIFVGGCLAGTLRFSAASQRVYAARDRARQG
jgi:hypothetical protein